MTEAIVTKENSGAVQLAEDQKTIQVLQNSLYPGAKAESVQMVLAYCKARHLDPFLKPVHIVPMYDKTLKANRDVIMPGLNLYRTQAAESGKLAGIDEVQFGPMRDFTFKGQEKEYKTQQTASFDITIAAPEWAKVTVRRILSNGTIGAFTSTEFFEEAISLSKDGKPTPMWVKRPRGMLSKTAESQALRKAFPDLGAAETAEEMTGRSLSIEDTPPSPPENDAHNLEICEKAFAAANEGTESYKEFWKSITQEDRKAIAAAYPQGLRRVAEEADATIAETIEEVK